MMLRSEAPAIAAAVASPARKLWPAKLARSRPAAGTRSDWRTVPRGADEDAGGREGGGNSEEEESRVRTACLSQNLFLW